MHIALASDNNYAIHLGVHIQSILETNARPLSIHVLEKNISSEVKVMIKDLVLNHGSSAIFYPISFEHEVGGKTPSYINEVAVYRLLMPNLLSDVERVIYIDVDAITLASLEPLWSMDLGSNLIALAESPWRKYREYKKTIGLGENDPYFNSGTMVVDLARMREENTESALLDEFLNHRERYEYPDQDVLNIVLKGRIAPLHPRWCVVGGTYGMRKGDALTFSAVDVEDAKRNPGIAQYSGKIKPWHVGSRHPLAYKYNYARQFTPWALPYPAPTPRISDRPLVSVIMATRNGEATLKESVYSILSQTLRSLELIIVDDGSTDRTPEMLARYARRDNRVVVLRNEMNIGLPASLNRAIDVARGRYLARMDDDDISMPERLESQTSFLHSNPDIHVCGALAKVIRPTWHEPEDYSYPMYEMDEQIKLSWLSRPGIIHPTAVIRAEFIHAHHIRYDPTYFKAQDFELWTRMGFYHRARFHNLQVPLLRYRIKATEVVREIRAAQENFAYAVHLRNLGYLGITDPTIQDLHARWVTRKFTPADQKRQRDNIARHVERLFLANREHHLWDQRALEKELMKPYRKQFDRFYDRGMAGVEEFKNFPLHPFFGFTEQQMRSFEKAAKRRDFRRNLRNMPVVGLLIFLAKGAMRPERLFNNSK